MSEKLNTTGKRQFGKKTQVGETIRWNKQKKSGWVYDGKHWVHYRKGKPTGKKERHRETARSPFKGLGVGTLARTILRIPSEKEYEKAKKAKQYSDAKKAEKAKNEASGKEILDRAKKNLTKPKTKNEKTRENINKSREVIEKYKNKDKLKEQSTKKSKTQSSTPKKRLTAREKMRAKNVERFGQEHVDKLRAKHADFKKMKKKEMSKADFIKKYPKSQTAKRSRR